MKRSVKSRQIDSCVVSAGTNGEYAAGSKLARPANESAPTIFQVDDVVLSRSRSARMPQRFFSAIITGIFLQADFIGSNIEVGVTESLVGPNGENPMIGLPDARKILLFGLLGALGCLAGWFVGEMFLWASLPASKEAGGSLASKPVLPSLANQAEQSTPAPPALVGADLSFKRAKPAPPPPAFPTGSPGSAPAPPPAEFAQRLEKAGAKSGDVQITLIWSNFNDLDLHCIEPSGEQIYYAQRRSKTGGELDVDANAGGRPTNQPVENIYWPKGKAPLGTYKVYVNHYSNRGGKDPTDYKVNVLVGGRRQEFTGKISRNDPISLITEFEVKPGSLEMPSDAPDLRLAVSPELVVNQGSQNQLKVRISRANIAGAVTCRFMGDLTGISAPEFTIAADETEANAEITADAAVALGTRTLTLTASAGATKADANFRLTVNASPPELRLAVSPALVVNQGARNRMRIRISRSGLKGPVQVRFQGDLQGIAPSEFSAGETDTEITAEIRAEAGALAGERTLTVTASADGVEANTSFQLTVNQVSPMLRLALPDEIRISPGGKNQLPVRIARDRFTGPVTVRLDGDMDGVSPEVFVIPSGRDDEEVTLTATESSLGTREIRVRAASGNVQTEGKLQIIVAKPASTGGPRWSWWLIFVIGLWTALLTLGLSLALVMGQNWYLARPWLSLGEFAVVTAGSVAAGIIAGGVGQALYSLLSLARLVPEIGFLAGWVLLGSLLGRGLVFFIPNMSAWRAVAAGSCGGLLGAVAFIAVSFVGDIAGRFMGAAILGLALGLMVAIVETAFRKIWLEVVDDQGVVRVVNLGATPVFIGGDARRCTVLVVGAPLKALKFWEENGQVYCLDILAEKTYPVSPGYRHPLKNSEVVVCSNGRSAKLASASAPAPAVRLKEPKPVPPATVPMKKSLPGPHSVTAPTPKPAVSPKASQPPTAPASFSSKPVPPPQKQTPSVPVTGACPVCSAQVKGVAGKRRCPNCWTMF